MAENQTGHAFSTQNDDAVFGSSTSSPTGIIRKEDDNFNLGSHGFSDYNSIPLSNGSFSQINVFQQNQLKTDERKDSTDTDDAILKLSDELEKTCLSVPSTPWHELSANQSNEISENDAEKMNDFIKLQNFDGTTMVLDDRSAGMRKAQFHQNGEMGQSIISRTPRSESQQEVHRPRMILGGTSSRQVIDDREQVDIEEGNRKLREMLGMPRQEREENAYAPSPGRMHDVQAHNNFANMTTSMNAAQYQQGMYQNGPQPPMTRLNQASGNRIPTSVGMHQQMYYVPQPQNYLVPPPPLPTQGVGRNQQMVYPQILTNPNTNGRFGQNMIRVPFVYVQQVPVPNVHPSNNNHNNSSSSNPHDNRNNLATFF